MAMRRIRQFFGRQDQPVQPNLRNVALLHDQETTALQQNHEADQLAVPAVAHRKESILGKDTSGCIGLDKMFLVLIRPSLSNTMHKQGTQFLFAQVQDFNRKNCVNDSKKRGVNF
jgi:hypothetical protein